MPYLRGGSGLWSQRAFALLWTGQSVSQLGSQVTLVALPLTAILVLSASPLQVGVLFAAGYAPAAVVGLLAGALVDRLRRRPLLIACQTVLGLTTLTIPLAGWLGLLTFEYLLVLQAINGGLSVVSSAASTAYLPHLVDTTQLTEANARLATSRAVARVTGPAVAGALVQLLSAPTAILTDGLSFLFCAVCVGAIHDTETAPGSKTRSSVVDEVREGVSLALRHRLLRPLLLALGTYNFFAALFTAVQTLFMVRDLGLEPAVLGAVIASGGLGGVLGGLVAEGLTTRFGTGRSIVGGAMLLAVMHVPMVVAAGPVWLVAPLLATSSFFAQLGASVLEINRTTLIQQLVPSHRLGRVSATQQVVVLAAVPIGAALGGVVGDSLGLRLALGLGAFGTILAAVSLLRSPLWSPTIAFDAADEASRTEPQLLATGAAPLDRRQTTDDLGRMRVK